MKAVRIFCKACNCGLRRDMPTLEQLDFMRVHSLLGEKHSSFGYEIVN